MTGLGEGLLEGMREKGVRVVGLKVSGWCNREGDEVRPEGVITRGVLDTP